MILGCIVILIYLLPSVIAWWRGHRSEDSIVVINLFLGWTFVGWVIALAWAVGDARAKNTANV